MRDCTVPRATPSRRATSTTPTRGCARSISSRRASSPSISSDTARKVTAWRARWPAAARAPRRARDPQHDQRGDRAEDAGGDEDRQVVALPAAHEARAPRRDRAADLVEREHPPEDDARLLRPEAPRGQARRSAARWRSSPGRRTRRTGPACSSASSARWRAGRARARAARSTRTAAGAGPCGRSASPTRSCPRCRGCPSRASIPAAVVAGIPWSWAAGMKCTAIRPTVVAPQTKKRRRQRPERAGARGLEQHLRARWTRPRRRAPARSPSPP